ncbi:uncharacterized, partial [Tachysurus ichikawai]
SSVVAYILLPPNDPVTNKLFLPLFPFFLSSLDIPPSSSSLPSACLSRCSCRFLSSPLHVSLSNSSPVQELKEFSWDQVRQCSNSDHFQKLLSACREKNITFSL